jgi:hypothetical protein
VVERDNGDTRLHATPANPNSKSAQLGYATYAAERRGPGTAMSGNKADRPSGRVTTLGWAPTCRCDAGAPVPQVVADPFTGAGTVGVVALRHGRAFWGAELNPAYVEMANRRIADDCPLFNQQTEGAA